MTTPLTTTAAFIPYLALVKSVRPYVPFPLEIRSPIMGRTTAGYLLMHLEDSDGNTWCEWYCIPAAVRYGKRRGYFISNHFTNSPEVFKSAKETYGLDTLTGVMKADTSKGGLILHNNSGARFMARASIRTLLPSVTAPRVFTFFTFNNNRLHEFSIEFSTRPTTSLSRLHVDRSASSFNKPLVKLPSLLWRNTAVNITAPDDIDLRGFHPRPNNEFHVD